MKTKTVAVVAFLTLSLFLCVSFVAHGRQSVFDGNRVKNPDCYTLEFTSMNQVDSHTLALCEGDILSVDFAIDTGKVDLKIELPEESAAYQGNNIKSGVFEITIPKDGNYRITVAARHASGYILLYASSESGS